MNYSNAISKSLPAKDGGQIFPCAHQASLPIWTLRFYLLLEMNHHHSDWNFMPGMRILVLCDTC